MGGVASRIERRKRGGLQEPGDVVVYSVRTKDVVPKADAPEWHLSANSILRIAEWEERKLNLPYKPTEIKWNKLHW